MFRKLCERVATEQPDLAVDIRAVQFRDLRKFTMTQWLEAGIPMLGIFQLAGYSPMSIYRRGGPPPWADWG